MSLRAILILFTLASFHYLCVKSGVDGIGMCWGRQTSQKLLPSMVVDMLLGNRIKKVHLFMHYESVVSAFAGSNISLMVTIPNQEFLMSNTTQRARAWVKQNITDNVNNGVDITHVMVANEPYSLIDTYNDTSYVRTLVTSLRNIQNELDSVKFSHGRKIKATIPHYTDILKPGIKKPSEGDFNETLKPEIIHTLKMLRQSGAPFMLHIYPLLGLYQFNWPLEFGFFDGSKQNHIKDGKITYENAFDAIYDTVASALNKNGFMDLKIVVGQVGWPTDGDRYATKENAKRFYDGFLEKMRKGIGTPLRPEPLDAYLYSLTDENQRIMARNPSHRHYGLYTYDGKPKFPLDLRIEGNKNYWPINATGISYMPKRWCILNTTDTRATYQDLVMKNFDYACWKADCSPLAYGGSCHGLDFEGNISYAFNIHFQMTNQDIYGDSCNFNGLGMVVDQDPSREHCTFPLQILSTIFVGGARRDGKNFGKSRGETLIWTCHFGAINSSIVL